MKKIVASPNAPAAIGAYSQAVISNDTIYVSGQLPIDPATGEFPAGGFKEQAAQSLNNVKAILQEGGFEMGDVVKVTVYLQDLANFAALNEVYSQYFSKPYPARVAFQAAALPKNAMVEIDVIAAK